MKRIDFEKKLNDLSEKVIFEINKFWANNSNIPAIENNRHIISHTVLDPENEITHFTREGIYLSNQEKFYYDHLPLNDLVYIVNVLRAYK